MCLISPLHSLGIFYYKNLWKFSADYNTYEAEFNTVKDYLNTDYFGANKIFSVVKNESSGKELFDLDTEKYISLPSNEKRHCR